VRNLPITKMSYGVCEDAAIEMTITGGGQVLIIKRADGSGEKLVDENGNFNNVHLEPGDAFANANPEPDPNSPTEVTIGLGDIPAHDISFTRDATTSPPPSGKLTGRYHEET